MSTNQRQRKVKKPLFEPGCVKCGKIHMSMACPEKPETEAEKQPEKPETKAEKQPEKKAMNHVAPIRSATWKEVNGGACHDNNNSPGQRNRNFPPRRGRGGGGGGGQRAAQQRPPPPSSSQASNRQVPSLMRGYQPRPNNNNPVSSQYPTSSPGFNGPRRSNGGGFNSSSTNNNQSNYRNRNERTRRHQQGQKKCVVPPNAEHMAWLNNQLRPFSYGTEDMYREVSMTLPTPPMTPKKVSTSTPAKREPPRLPKDKMYVFRTTTILNGDGKTIKSTETNLVVDVTGDMLIFVDLGDDLVF